MTDDPMPASFVWTGDDGPEDMQKVPDGPALGNYVAGPLGPVDQSLWLTHKAKLVMDESYRDLARGGPYTATNPDRRSTMGEKLARFLNDLAEKVRGVH